LGEDGSWFPVPNMCFMCFVQLLKSYGFHNEKFSAFYKQNVPWLKVSRGARCNFHVCHPSSDVEMSHTAPRNKILNTTMFYSFIASHKGIISVPVHLLVLVVAD
jgi:hypothetical protein